MNTWQIILSVYGFCWVALLFWSFFNQNELKIGGLILGIVLAPFVFIVWYADWDAKVIVWRRKP